MADEPTDKRPWWMFARAQGVALMAVGIVMLFSPITAPVAGTVITVGAGWASGGTVSALARKFIK